MSKLILVLVALFLLVILQSGCDQKAPVVVDVGSEQKAQKPTPSQAKQKANDDVGKTESKAAD